MANPSVTYTFTNGTTADGSQVSQNFTDLINSMTDGTKSFSIDALTVGGAALFNGAVTLGNASGDDITFTGSLSSSIPLKADSTYDIGTSTVALRACYTDKIQSGSTAGIEIVGRTDGSGHSAGAIGQKIDFTARSVTCTNATTWYANSTEMGTLTAGIYLLFLEYSFAPGNTASVVYGVAATNGTGDNTGFITTAASVNSQNASGSNACEIHFTGYLNVSANQAVYAKAFSEDQAGLAVTVSGFAIRIG